MGGPLLIAVLVMVAVVFFFLALQRAIAGAADPVDQRLAQYGLTAESVVEDPAVAAARPKPSLFGRLAGGLGMGAGLAEKLSRADIAMTTSEFGLLIIALGLAGFLLGWWRVGLPFGLVIGLVLGYAPFLYLGSRVHKREIPFTNQLPDVLDLLVGSLRAGYGVQQAIGTLVDQLPPPASEEFRRVTRAIELGVPVTRALDDLTTRITTQDVQLVVTAINVQHEMGGNLAETLETIGYTVRDRLRMLRERSLTAQQRLTAYILAFTPVFLGVLLAMISPGYMDPLFQPGWVRALPIGAAVLMGLGFMVIKKIVDIEV